jgi:Fe/S biogenesis protein NfuA
MLTFTKAATAKVLSFMADYYDDGEPASLRIAVREGTSPLAPDYELMLVESDDVEPEDVVFRTDDFAVVVEGASAEKLKGCIVDFTGVAFEVKNPNIEAMFGATTGAIADRVRQVLDERVNPGVASHGGKISLVGVQDTTVLVQMSGGCQGCGLAKVTLRQGVERMIKESIPEVTAVHDVTDHMSGANPFYQSAAATP